ncbi:MAG: methylenetetrahydrofolate reductase [Candidatus Odinarchaeia archaeon]
MSVVYSNLMKEITQGRFVFTGEVEPEKTTNLTHIVEEVRKLKDYVTAVNVTDNPQAYGYISSLVASYVVQRDTGVETVYQLTCRDRNRLALLSDLLGAGALGLRNVLALTGDHTTLGDNPQAKPVFDLDSVQLTLMIRRIVDEGVDLAGNPINDPPKFYIGVAANPNAEYLEPEIIKLEKKVEAGADFVQTQVVYDIEIAKNFLDLVRYLNRPIIIGICPLKSLQMAEYLHSTVPGISIPPDLLDKLREAKNKHIDKADRKRAYEKVNIEFFSGFIRELRKTTSAAGCHIMAVGFEYIIKDIIENSRVT